MSVYLDVTGSFYSYSGTLVELGNVTVVPAFNSVGGAIGINDDDGELVPTESTDISFGVGSETMTYEGVMTFNDYDSGLVGALLGALLGSTEAAVFTSSSGEVYIYAPDGFPGLAGVAASISIDETATFDIPPPSTDAVDGTYQDDSMPVGYEDLDGDEIRDEGWDGIFYYDGDDEIYGYAGDDTIDGGTGDDTIDGGDDDDSISGGDGNDIIYGGDGNDTIDDGAGADAIYAGDGDDVWITSEIFSNGASDTVYLQGGDDYARIGWIEAGTDEIIDGGEGRDTFSLGGEDATYDLSLTLNDMGSATSDISANNVILNFENLEGTNGANALTGNLDDNYLWGLAGADTLDGGAGADTLDGGAGDDTLTGGSGDDVFIWDQTGNDVITDFGTDSGGVGDTVTGNNDFVDLSGVFNSTTLDNYNTENSTSFTHAIHAMNHDLADGVVNFNGTNMSGPTLTMTGVTGGLTADQTNVTCFASGTKIKTRNGEVNIDDLKVGDEILTLDCGYKPIRWIGSSPISSHDLALNPQLRPIRISAGSLGVGLPESDLLVSPQHRVLVRSNIAQRMFGEYEVLMAAKHLTDIEGIKIAEDHDQVTYWHFLFQEHQIVFSNGAPTESLFTGSEALKSVSPEARDEIFKIFPELNTKEKAETVSARMLISGRRARKFAERSAENKKLLVA